MFTLVFAALNTQSVSSNRISTANGESESYSGDYEGDLSIMYFEQNWNSSIWVNASSSTNIIPYNKSYYDKEYEVRSLDIRADNLINISCIGYYEIAENTSSQISLTPSYRFTEAFEEQFGIHLKKWTGEISIFKGAEVIVNKNFPIDVEGQIIRGVRGKLIEFRNKLETMIQAREIISLMREITEFISRYRTIVNEYYIDYYLEIIKIAEEKISSA